MEMGNLLHPRTTPVQKNPQDPTTAASNYAHDTHITTSNTITRLLPNYLDFGNKWSEQ